MGGKVPKVKDRRLSAGGARILSPRAAFVRYSTVSGGA
jgi:hypothetical protein